MITRLGPHGHGTRLSGSFAGREEVVLPPAPIVVDSFTVANAFAVDSSRIRSGVAFHRSVIALTRPSSMVARQSTVKRRAERVERMLRREILNAEAQIMRLRSIR